MSPLVWLVMCSLISNLDSVGMILDHLMLARVPSSFRLSFEVEFSIVDQ